MTRRCLVVGGGERSLNWYGISKVRASDCGVRLPNSVATAFVLSVIMNSYNSK